MFRPSISPTRQDDPPAGNGSAAVACAGQHALVATGRSPFPDAAIPLWRPRHLLDSNAHLLRRLRLTAGVSDLEFESRYECVLIRLASHVGALPACRSRVESAPGGLFRQGLDLAIHCVQTAEGVIFCRGAGVEQRRTLEPAWRYACFLAGVSSAASRSIASMSVAAPDGETWPAFRQGLGAWLEAKQADSCVVRWRDKLPSAEQGRALALLLVPGDCLEFLNEASPQIVPDLLDMEGGVRRTALRQVVETVWSRVLELAEEAAGPNDGRGVSDPEHGHSRARLSAPVRQVLDNLLSDLGAGRAGVDVVATAAGVAISVERLASSCNGLRLIDEFHAAGWLVTEPHRPERKAHSVELGGRTTISIVVTPAAAKALGFLA